MSAPLFPWDNNNSSGAIGASTAIGGMTTPPLKLGAPISGAAPGNNSGALTPHPIMGPPSGSSSGHPIPPPVSNGRTPNNATALVGHSGQQVRPQPGSAAGVVGAVAASNAAHVTNTGNPVGATPMGQMAHMPPYGGNGMMGPYGSSSMMGMPYGGMMGAYGGMSGAYGSSGMMMGSGMMGGASHAMMGQAGAAGAAAAVGPDGRPIAPVAKLQGWAIFAELASRLVQVIMHMARSGHEVFSVVAGSYWAFTSIRAMLGLGGTVPMHPLIQQQQQALAIKNGATPAAAAAMVGRSSKTTANAAAANATTTAATNAAAAAAPAGSSGRRTALLFGLFMVVATIMEFLYRRHQDKKKQQELEALQRKLLLTHNSSNAPAASAAAAASDATAQGAAAGSSSTRCVAIHDFAGDGDGQLAFRCGDQLEVKEFDPNGWCFAASTGIAREDPAAARGAVDEASANPSVTGWVPGNFLRPLLQHRKL